MVTSNSDFLGSQMAAADAEGHFSFIWTNVPAGNYRVHAVGLSSSPSMTDSPPTPDLAFTVTAPTPATQQKAPVGGSSTTPVAGSSTTPVAGSSTLSVSGSAPAQAPTTKQTGGAVTGTALSLSGSTPYVILHKDTGGNFLNETNPGSTPEPLRVNASVDVYSDGTVRVHLDAKDTSSFSIADSDYTVSAHVIVSDGYLDHLLDATPTVTVGRPYTAAAPLEYIGEALGVAKATPSSQSQDFTSHVPVVSPPDGPASIYLYVTAEGGLNSGSSTQSAPSAGTTKPVFNF